MLPHTLHTPFPHLDDLVDDLGVEDTGDEAGANALDLVGAGLRKDREEGRQGRDG